jgi:hypothetical protein
MGQVFQGRWRICREIFFPQIRIPHVLGLITICDLFTTYVDDNIKRRLKGSGFSCVDWNGLAHHLQGI